MVLFNIQHYFDSFSTELTKAPDPSIGDRILTLSANANPNFLEGCDHAAEFYREWQAVPDHVQDPYYQRFLLGGTPGSDALIPNGPDGWPPQELVSIQSAAAAIWIRHFESHLTPPD